MTINTCILVLQSETDLISRYLCDNNISAKVGLSLSQLHDTRLLCGFLILMATLTILIGIAIQSYHSGIPAKNRSRTQELFCSNKIRVVRKLFSSLVSEIYLHYVFSKFSIFLALLYCSKYNFFLSESLTCTCYGRLLQLWHLEWGLTSRMLEL